MRTAMLTALVLSLGCTAAPAIQKATYPPSFAYVERSDVRSEMWSLAKDVASLDQMLRESDASAEQVANVLRNMEGTAQALRDRGIQTNHPRLDANLELFLKDLTGARKAVEAEPANYFLAGAVSGSCLYCHR